MQQLPHDSVLLPRASWYDLPDYLCIFWNASGVLQHKPIEKFLTINSAAFYWSTPFWTGLESTRWWRTLGGYSNAQWCFAGLRDRPTPVSLFHDRPPRCPWSTGAALCGWCHNGHSADTDHEPSLLLHCSMGLDEEMGPAEQSYQMQLPQHWVRSSPEIPRWVWHFIQISQGSRGSNR